MILSFEDIKRIILTRPNSAFVLHAQKYNKTMRLHMYGEGLEGALGIIPGFEKEEANKLRVKYARSNKDLFSRLRRPIDKVFSARGGSIYYNLSEKQDKTAMGLANSLRGGMTVKKWIENFWQPHFLDDPNGFIFMEIDAEGNTYPTYKNICSVHDYQQNGASLDYVVFKTTKEEKVKYGLKEDDIAYRVVDDAFDYIVRQEGDNITIIQDQTYPNYYLKVPAILNSDIVNANGVGYVSLFDEVIHLAEQFLLKGSIKITHDFLHGFPKYWEYADDCPDCKGTGYLGAEQCGSCKGTGKKLMTKVSDAKLLPFPEDRDSPTVTPNVAGYVSPDKTYYDIATAELNTLEEAMHFTIWGSSTGVKTQGVSQGKEGVKTATEVMDDQQPKIDRLAAIADMAEKRHKFILDHIIKLKISPAYTGSSVNYGRRFMIESPDSIWDRYSEARTSKAPLNILDNLLSEFIETKYSGDPVSLAVQYKLIATEPFVHSALEDLKDLPIPPIEIQRKSFFPEWLNSKSDYELLGMDVEQMKADLTAFVLAKSEQNALTQDDTPLAVKLGVGGTQALQAILSDPGIAPDSKKNVLEILFGISPEEAGRMVSTVKPPAAPEPAPKTFN